MRFENTAVMNFENAFRGMRNPKESYHLSDSSFGITDFNGEETWNVTNDWMCFLQAYIADEDNKDELEDNLEYWLNRNGILNESNGYYNYAFLGPKDLKLAQNLIMGGPEHRKFLRQIFVSVDITAPLYWWKEFDTYKVGTVANSTSTMHTIQNKPITLDCFEIGDYNNDLLVHEYGEQNYIPVSSWINYLESLRQKYVETKDSRYWKELIRWLPESWLQTRTVTMNYENLLAMCSKGQRRFHKLTEWSGKTDSFISWARTLPYAKELIFLDELIKDGEKAPFVDF